MDHNELTAFLAGKTIKEALTSSFSGFAIIHTLVFDDGSELELGAKVVAYAEWVKVPDEDRVIPMGIGKD